MIQMRAIVAAKMNATLLLAGKLPVAPGKAATEEFKVSFRTAAGTEAGAIGQPVSVAPVSIAPSAPVATKDEREASESLVEAQPGPVAMQSVGGVVLGPVPVTVAPEASKSVLQGPPVLSSHGSEPVQEAPQQLSGEVAFLGVPPAVSGPTHLVPTPIIPEDRIQQNPLSGPRVLSGQEQSPATSFVSSASTKLTSSVVPKLLTETPVMSSGTVPEAAPKGSFVVTKLTIETPQPAAEVTLGLQEKPGLAELSSLNVPRQPVDTTKASQRNSFAVAKLPSDAAPLQQTGLKPALPKDGVPLAAPVVTELPPVAVELVAAHKQPVSQAPTVAAPEKKIGKGALAPVETHAPVLAPLPTTVAVPVVVAPVVTELTSTDKTSPVGVAETPTKSLKPGLQAPKVTGYQFATSEPAPNSADSKLRGSAPKGVAPLTTETPVATADVAHADPSGTKPAMHGDPLQVPVQKVEGHPVALASPIPIIAPVISAGPLTTGQVAARNDVMAAPSHVAPEPAQTLQPGDVRTLDSSAQTLEVGVATGTHGWLRVRAEMGSTGEVTASVVASSPVAAEALHRGLPALHEYLAHEQLGLVSVGVSSAARPPDGGAEGTVAAGLASGSRGQEQRGQQTLTGPQNNSAGPLATDDLQTFAETPLLLQARSAGGGWLSVRV